MSQNELTSLPECLKKLNPRFIYFSHNLISTIPDWIGNFNRLTALNLRENQISEIPKAITACRRLYRLVLSKNQISQLPAQFSQMTSLVTLYLKENRLTEFPAQLCDLTRLKTLPLSDNDIQRIPPDIINLTQLKTLNLGNTGLSELPDALFELSGLEELGLERNKLQTLSKDVRKLRRLSKLRLQHNQLTELPSSLERLRKLTSLQIFGNHIQKLSKKIYRLISPKSRQEFDRLNTHTTLPEIINRDLTNSFHYSITECMTPLMQTKKDHSLERTYSTQNFVAGSKAVAKHCYRAGEDVLGGLRQVSIGLLQSIALTGGASCISAFILISTLYNMAKNLLLMEFVIATYVTAEAVKGIAIDPLLLLFNGVQYLRGKQHYHLGASLIRTEREGELTWYGRQLNAILNHNETGISAQHFAHHSFANNISLLACFIDFFNYQCHALIKTTALATRAGSSMGHVYKALPGTALSHTAHGAWRTTRGSLMLLAGLPIATIKPVIRLLVTEAMMFHHEGEPLKAEDTTEFNTMSYAQSMSESLLSGVGLADKPSVHLAPQAA